jgi:membrane-associated phospholipid phosphatase
MIPHVTRISSDVWFALGIHDFPSVYNKISPNPVAAVPSLHAAYATLFAMFAIKLFKTKWRYLSIVYPIMIYVGTVYQGEHYLIDELAGGLYAVCAFAAAPYVLRYLHRSYRLIRRSITGPWLVPEDNRQS